MISHRHRCIFIHIPKCAGTSIEHALGHFDGHTGRAGQDHRSIRMICKPVPVTRVISNLENSKDFIRRIREYYRKQANPSNAINVSKKEYDSYFKFTIVRDPVERAFSWYKNAMRDPIHQKNYGISPDISFDHFIKSFAGTGFLRPQTYWLKDYRGDIPMDFIGKFESLTEDFQEICTKLGVEHFKLPHKIEGQTSRSVHAINEGTRKFIRNFYAEDYEIFGYS